MRREAIHNEFVVDGQTFERLQIYLRRR